MVLEKITHRICWQGIEVILTFLSDYNGPSESFVSISRDQLPTDLYHLW